MKRPMTPNGNSAMRREVQKFRAMRPELAHAIEVARAQGDLSENADYDAAKEKSGMVEAKIRDIENKITQAQVVDPRDIKSHETVVFGLSVKIADVDSGDKKTYHLVGSDESDLTKGRISFESPLGRSLIGKSEGDIVRAELPGGIKELEILEIFCGYEPDPVAQDAAASEEVE
jgi:transcription elongation factor GreA